MLSNRQVRVLIKARQKSQDRVMRALAFPIGMIVVIGSLFWGAM